MHRRFGMKDKLISKDEALELLFSKWNPEIGTETVPVYEAFGRTLAEDVYALYDIPVVRASAMDGVAFNFAAYEADPDTTKWKRDVDYCRADTGDDFPDEFDSVVKIENVEMLPEGGLKFRLPEGESIKKNMNVKPGGANYRKGELVAKTGRMLNPQLLSSIASGGHAEVKVVRMPVVGYIPTGSELVKIGVTPARGQNINSNSLLVFGMVMEMGALPMCYPIVKDDMEEIEAALKAAMEECDVVLLSGGSSKGEEDFSFKVMEKCGELLAHGVKTVPGRPMSIGLVDGKPCVNISGPALAAMNCLDWCVSAIVGRLLGVKPHGYPEVEAVLDGRLNSPDNMEMMSLLDLYRDGEGRYHAVPMKPELKPGQQPSKGPGGPKARQADTFQGKAMYRTALGEGGREAGDVIRVKMLCSPEEAEQ